MLSSKQVRSIVYCVILTLSSIYALDTSVSAQSTGVNYSYGYVSAFTQTDIVISLVDPLAPTGVETSVNVARPANFSLEFLQSSPDGHWIALVFGFPYQERRIQIFNVITLELETVAQLRYVDDNLLRIYEPEWSPDSSYFAFIGTLSDDSTQNTSTYVYSVHTDVLTIIKEYIDSFPTVAPYAISWLPNSNQLTILQSYCRNLLCDTLFEVWSVEPISLDTTINFDVLNGSTIYTCPLAWSPNSQYFTFRLICNDLASMYFNELFVWDISQNNITQLTNYTNPAATSGQFQEYSTVYAPIWLDADSMLLSSFNSPLALGSGLVSDGSVNLTQIIEFPTLNTSTLDTTQRYGFVSNPVSGEMAYRANSFVDDGNGYLALQDAHVEIATINALNFITVHQGSAGCNLSWSPDGQTLAYTSARIEYGEIFCLRPTSLIFVDNAQYQVSTHILPSMDEFLGVGWIAVSTPNLGSETPIATSTLTSTPTATETITPTSTPTAATSTLTSTPTATETITPTSTPTATPPASGTGTGLRGEYFDDTTFTALKLTRVDPTINFNWLYGSPTGRNESSQTQNEGRMTSASAPRFLFAKS